MKKNVLILLSVLVVAMFLVGCVETAEDTVDVVDEEGNLVGEASRFQQKGLKKTTVQVSGAAKDVFTAGQCQKQAEDCGFVTEKALPEKIDMKCVNDIVHPGFSYNNFEIDEVTPIEYCEQEYSGYTLISAQRHVYEVVTKLKRNLIEINWADPDGKMFFPDPDKNFEEGHVRYSITCCKLE